MRNFASGIVKNGGVADFQGYTVELKGVSRPGPECSNVIEHGISGKGKIQDSISFGEQAAIGGSGLVLGI